VRRTVGGDSGFTLVEMTSSVAILLVVLTAAWLLLTVSNDNLNRIDQGGQAAELNRAALASFERDLNHSVLPAEDVSPILDAGATQCSMLVENNGRELVTWRVDTNAGALVRDVSRAPVDVALPASMSDFDGGTTTSTVALSDFSWEDVGGPVFSYKSDALTTWDGDPRVVGLVTAHFRNGLPNSKTNVTDRTAAFRVLSLVINGY
jgi:prepilin-type N-terminal cleavage/methylation domain-containing protein